MAAAVPQPLPPAGGPPIIRTPTGGSRPRWRGEASARLHLLGWSVACLGAVIASAGLAVGRLDMALSGSAVWLLAVTIQLAAILRRLFPQPSAR